VLVGHAQVVAAGAVAAVAALLVEGERELDLGVLDDVAQVGAAVEVP
jgi:hypothetical protein